MCLVSRRACHWNPNAAAEEGGGRSGGIQPQLRGAHLPRAAASSCSAAGADTTAAACCPRSPSSALSWTCGFGRLAVPPCHIPLSQGGAAPSTPEHHRREPPIRLGAARTSRIFCRMILLMAPARFVTRRAVLPCCSPPPGRPFPLGGCTRLGGGESGKRSETQSVRCAQQLCVPPTPTLLTMPGIDRLEDCLTTRPRTRSQRPAKRARTPEHKD
jgi:hypothetical protein